MKVPQSVLDAMADAETLRWFSYALISEANRAEQVRSGVRNRNKYGRHRILAPVPPSLELNPIVAELQLADAESVIRLAAVWNRVTDEVVRQIMDHARAAFRAVPGLR